jgi:preprotein translocase subunit SecG
MYTFLVVLHVVVSIFLILVVLLQQGKGAGMGAAFGGSAQTLFGARGQATPLQKITAVMAILFMVLSIALASLSGRAQSDLAGDDQPLPGKEAGLNTTPGPEEKNPAADVAPPAQNPPPVPPQDAQKAP